MYLLIADSPAIGGRPTSVRPRRAPVVQRPVCSKPKPNSADTSLSAITSHSATGITHTVPNRRPNQIRPNVMAAPKCAGRATVSAPSARSMTSKSVSSPLRKAPNQTRCAKLPVRHQTVSTPVAAPQRSRP